MALKLNESIHLVKRKEKTLVYSDKIGKLFETGDVGIFILDLIKEEKYSEEQVFDKLKKEFSDVDENQIKNDLNEFLNQLKEECILS